MFREIRRKKQQLSEEITKEVLMRNSSGVLSLLGDDGFPYGVPVNYAYRNGKLYFHGAKEGHKVDAIRNYDKASFTVVDQDKIVAKEYTSYFRSVIAFGKVRIIEDREEKEALIKVITNKYCENDEQGVQNHINKFINNINIIEFEVLHLTGKEAIELVNNK